MCMRIGIRNVVFGSNMIETERQPEVTVNVLGAPVIMGKYVFVLL